VLAHWSAVQTAARRYRYAQQVSQPDQRDRQGWAPRTGAGHLRAWPWPHRGFCISSPSMSSWTRWSPSTAGSGLSLCWRRGARGHFRD